MSIDWFQQCHVFCVTCLLAEVNSGRCMLGNELTKRLSKSAAWHCDAWTGLRFQE